MKVSQFRWYLTSENGTLLNMSKEWLFDHDDAYCEGMIAKQDYEFEYSEYTDRTEVHLDDRSVEMPSLVEIRKLVCAFLVKSTLGIPPEMRCNETCHWVGLSILCQQLNTRGKDIFENIDPKKIYEMIGAFYLYLKQGEMLWKMSLDIVNSIRTEYTDVYTLLLEEPCAFISIMGHVRNYGLIAWKNLANGYKRSKTISVPPFLEGVDPYHLTF